MTKISKEEKDRILAIAGNPHNGAVFPLLSIPNGYRIISRVYSYDPKKKRSVNQKLTLGAVIDGEYLTKEEYHAKFTKRGFARVQFPMTEEMPEADAGGGGAPSEEKECAQGAVLQSMLGAVPILHGSAVRCGIAEDLEKAYGSSVAKEILSLAIHWLQDKDNRARRFPRFSEQFALPFPGPMTEEQLAKLYSHLGRDKASLSRLFSLRFGRLKPNACVNYDSTSVATKASDVYSKKHSLSKKGIIEPIVHLSVLAEQETGMPLMYNMFSGNNPDCVTVLDLIRKTEELAGGKKDLLFVFDRGYETMNNLNLCSANGKNCLMAAASLGREFVRKVRDNYADFWDASSVIPGTTVHAHSEKTEVKHKGRTFSLWVHVFRSDEKSAAEHEGFFRMLDGFEKIWKNAPSAERQKLRDNKELMRFYAPCSDLSAELVRDDDALNAHTRNFGFFASVSVEEMTSERAYEVYKGRDGIEKCFESGKMGFKLGTARAHRQDTMEGRFVVAFVALSILAELKHQLSKRRTFEDKRKKDIPEKAYSVSDVLDITAGTTINYGVRTKQHWTGGLLKEHRRLCVACGFDEDLYDQKPAYLESWSSLK